MKFDRIISFKTVVYKQNKTINNNILIMSKNEYALDLHIPSDEIYITTYPDDREYFIYFKSVAVGAEQRVPGMQSRTSWVGMLRDVRGLRSSQRWLALSKECLACKTEPRGLVCYAM